MTVTQRGELTERDAHRLHVVMDQWRDHEEAMQELRNVIAGMVGRSSYRAVAEATGFSTNTLQRWKREAQ